MKPDLRRRAASDWLLLIVSGLVGLMMAGIVVQVALLNGLTGANVTALSSVAPRHPEVVMRLAQREFIERQDVSPATREKVLAAAARAPLAAEPFLFKGLAAGKAGRYDQAQAFLEVARERDPRSRIARLMLLDLYLRQGLIAEAAGEIRTLIRLIPDATRVLMPELVRIAMHPATARPLERVLAGDPLAAPLLKAMLDRGAPPEQVLGLARSWSLLRPAEKPQAWQTKLILALVEKGRLAQARSLWATIAGVLLTESTSLIQRPDFTGASGMAPFGWSFDATGSGFAEPSEEGLEVTYHGREQVNLAVQLVTLSPGRWRFAAEYEGRLNDRGGRLLWRLACHGSNRVLLELPLTGGDGVQTRAAAFSVPPGCPAQWLRLVGVPAEFPADQHATVRRIGLARGAGG